LAQGGGGQHDHAHRPHPRHRLRHDAAWFRPHRQYHLASIKHPIAALELSNGARLGLTGAVAVLARKGIRTNVTINGILPGPFDTDRLRGTTQKMAEARKVALSVVEAERKAAVPAGPLRLGGGVRRRRRLLCSAHAGYITGQNLLIDGGGYPGSL
jgi:3-oxoacyl-[acyl-carrier protein] reductase